MHSTTRRLPISDCLPIFLGCAFILLATTPNPSVASGIRTVALSGSNAPGTIGDTKFSAFNSPVINDAGQVVFRTVLSGTDVNSTNNEGLWSDGSGNLLPVARRGS